MESNIDEDVLPALVGHVEANQASLLAVPVALQMASPYKNDSFPNDHGNQQIRNDEFSSELQHAALLEHMPLVIEMVTDVLRNAQNAIGEGLTSTEVHSMISPVLLSQDSMHNGFDLIRDDKLANEDYKAEVSP